MSTERRQALLRQQRAAVLRAILRARYYEENGDAELLQSVVDLLDYLHDLAPHLIRKPLH